MNLAKIKKMANVFLQLDIKETDISFIAAHPFTNMWLTAVLDHGTCKTVDLHKKEDAKFWRDNLQARINESENLIQLLRLFHKPYILTFLKYIVDDLDEADLGRVLKYQKLILDTIPRQKNFWKSIEFPNSNGGVSTKTLVSWFKKAKKENLMNAEELNFLRNLPDMVTLYRGVSKYNQKNTKALSWSLEKEIAEYFATRFDDEGELWTIQVPKKRILCYFQAESEAIVDLHGFKEAYQKDICKRI